MKVLIVDDQALNRTLLRYMLEQEKHQVFEARDGNEALTEFDKCLPDIVLLDVVMPVMDGYQAAPLLKQKSLDVYLPIIFITALEDQASLLKCLQVGGDDFLNKPFDKVILSAKIKAHARTRELSIRASKQNQQLEYHQLQTEREHELVEHIFDNALKERFDIPPSIEFHMSPASMFNGDLFLVAPSRSGGVYVMLGDFTGHGLAAAIGALPASKVFYSMASKGLSVGDIAAELNQVLYDLLPGNMFCAANILEISCSGRSISAWLGGLPDSYVLNSNGEVRITLESMHMALGILEDYEFERDTMYVETTSQDRILLYTDGVVEAENPRQQYFGEERLLNVLKSSGYRNLDSIVEQVIAFSGTSDQQDDLSLVLIRCEELNLPNTQTNEFSTTPLEVNLTLDSELLKTTDPVLEFINIISSIKGIEQHRSNLFLLLSEMYNNALEHGVLQLDSRIKDNEDGFIEYYTKRADGLAKLVHGEITLQARFLPQHREILFCVGDSGDGFCTLNATSSDALHGRGVALMNEIASSVTYNEKGNQVTVTYHL